MNEFIVPPVISDHSKINNVLGRDWLKRQVDAALVATKRKQKLHPSTMSPKFGWVDHPLVSEAKQNVVDETRTPILDSLETDLVDLADVPLPSNLSQRLRDDHDFGKTAYELRIAAGFRRLGFSLVWCPPMKQRHPEFLVLTAKSKLVSVECKKRDASDGYERDASAFWKHLQYQLRQRMLAESLNYWVKVSGRNFDLIDLETLVSETISTIQIAESGQFDAVGGRYHVEYTRLADPGGSVDMEVINMFPRGVFGFNTGHGYRSMVGPVKNPRLLRMEFIDDPEHCVKGIVRNLKNAATQVIRGLSNLVYLDVNIQDYTREQAEFSNMVDAIRKELNTRHRHVSAVILTNIYPAFSLDEYLGWRIKTEFLAQPKPEVCLPEGFIFPGDIGSTRWLPEDALNAYDITNW